MEEVLDMSEIETERDVREIATKHLQKRRSLGEESPAGRKESRQEGQAEEGR